jgi:hypothetical protein
MFRGFIKCFCIFPIICYLAIAARLAGLLVVSKNADLVLVLAIFTRPGSLLAKAVSELLTDVVSVPSNIYLDFVLIFVCGLLQYSAIMFLIYKLLVSFGRVEVPRK